MLRPGGPALFVHSLSLIFVAHSCILSLCCELSVNVSWDDTEDASGIFLLCSFSKAIRRDKHDLPTYSGIQMTSVAQRCVREEITREMWHRGKTLWWCGVTTADELFMPLQLQTAAALTKQNNSRIWSLSTFGIQQHATKMHLRLEQNLLQILFKCQLKQS